MRQDAALCGNGLTEDQYVHFCSIVRELVTQDKNSVNDEDESSNTALHLAALAGHAKVATVLIEMGADVAARYKHV